MQLHLLPQGIELATCPGIRLVGTGTKASPIPLLASAFQLFIYLKEQEPANDPMPEPADRIFSSGSKTEHFHYLPQVQGVP